VIALCLVAATVAAPVRMVVGMTGNDLRAKVRAPEVRALLDRTHGVLVRRLPFAVVIDLEPAAVADLAVFPGVSWVEPDSELHIVLRAVPDDPLYVEQWAFRGGSDAAMDLSGAWDVTRGLDPGGTPVTVAVVDDGFDLTHPDLVDNLASEGYDLSQLPTDPDPSYGPYDTHGTQTAGVVAARGFNGLGLTGACPECRLLPIRLVGNSGPPDLFTSGSAIAEAMVWAVDHGAQVINNSWGPPDGNFYEPFHPVELWEEPAVVAEALRYAATVGRGGLGTLVVWSAGNGGELVTYDRFASDPRVLAIGSVDANGHLARYSDYGPGVRLVTPSSGQSPAPGIWTTDIAGAPGESPDDYTGGFGGTSASAAMASGLAGLVLARYPALTMAQLTEALLMSAFPIDAARSPYLNGVSRLYGCGRIDPAGALVSAASYSDDHTFWLEICDNGIDDDGNGVIDDPEQCTPCIPDYPTELCDGRDNNCDGQVDEGFACQQTDRPTCAPCTSSNQCAPDLLCRAAAEFPGSWCLARCGTGGVCEPGYACDGEICSLTVDATHLSCLDALTCKEAEHCDGLDNDCDGLVDEDDVCGATKDPTASEGCRGCAATQAATWLISVLALVPARRRPRRLR
jgi:subtilisin family serine protease